MSGETIKPEDCPEPFWHETHRYCPVCSWREPQEEPPPTVESQALALLIRWCEGWSDESEFPLLDETRALLAATAKDGTP